MWSSTPAGVKPAGCFEADGGGLHVTVGWAGGAGDGRRRRPPQRGGHLHNSHGLRAAPGAARPPLCSQRLPCSSLALPVAVTCLERTASPPSFAAVGRAVRAMGSHSYSQAAQPGSIVLRSVTQNLAPSPQCLQGRAHWLPRLKDGLRQRGSRSRRRIHSLVCLAQQALQAGSAM
jgi:hypothetical protein